MINLAIFVSGGGSNCENLIRYFKTSDSVYCALVVSNKADAYALERAGRLGVPTAVVPKVHLNDERIMMPLLEEYRIDFIVLAGFLPLIPDFLINAFPRRIINIHPALLPKYVTPVCDSGEIIAQYKTQLSPTDSVDDIAEKEHLLEMEYYPKVVEQVLKDTFKVL